MTKGKAKDILAGMEKEKLDEAKQRIKRCLPIALYVLQEIGSGNAVLGEAEEVKEAEVYNEMAARVLAKMLEVNMLFHDKQFVFQLAHQAMEMVEHKTLTSLNMSFDKVLNKALGKDFLDVTMSDLDAQLK